MTNKCVPHDSRLSIFTKHGVTIHRGIIQYEIKGKQFMIIMIMMMTTTTLTSTQVVKRLVSHFLWMFIIVVYAGSVIITCAYVCLLCLSGSRSACLCIRMS